MKHLLLFLILTYSCACLSQRLYVIQDGSGNKNGDSWLNAMDDLNRAIEEASSGDTIFVGPGKFEGGFFLKEGVCVIGSVDTGNEKDNLNVSGIPLIKENATILDGCSLYRVITQESNFNTPTSLEGFIIRNGNANEGAGVRLRKNGIIKNCIIENNKAGMPSVGDYITADIGIVFDVDQNNNTISVISSKDINRNHQLDRAVQIANEYKAGGTSNWHIPSMKEWQTISGIETSGNTKARVTFRLIEKAIGNHGKKYLSGNTFWTSTTDGDNAMFINLNSNEILSINKWQYNKVRVCKTYQTNKTMSNGGGVNATGGTIENCIIKGNTATNGSGIYARGEMMIKNSYVSDNINEKQLDIDDKVIIDNTPNKISTLNADKVSISPNPVHAGEKICISYLQENEKVNLYDVNGHLLSSFVLNDTKQINAPTQPGLYFVRIGNSKSIKLIVTK